MMRNYKLLVRNSRQSKKGHMSDGMIWRSSLNCDWDITSLIIKVLGTLCNVDTPLIKQLVIR